MDSLFARLGITLVVAAVVLAGCTATETERREPGNQTGNQTGGPAVGGNVSTPAGNASVGAGEAINVDMVDNAYQPDNLQIEQGQSVRFSNVGAVRHNVVLQREGAVVQQEDRDVDPDQDTVVTFTEPGLYMLRCKYHSTDFDNGMVGRITVG